MNKAIPFNNSILIVNNIVCINIEPDKVFHDGEYKYCMAIHFVSGINIQSFYSTHEEAVEKYQYLLNEINSQEERGYLEESDYD